MRISYEVFEEKGEIKVSCYNHYDDYLCFFTIDIADRERMDLIDNWRALKATVAFGRETFTIVSPKKFLLANWLMEASPKKFRIEYADNDTLNLRRSNLIKIPIREDGTDK